ALAERGRWLVERDRIARGNLEWSGGTERQRCREEESLAALLDRLHAEVSDLHEVSAVVHEVEHDRRLGRLARSDDRPAAQLHLDARAPGPPLSHELNRESGGRDQCGV